ncbi:MAG TPA: hypothetical protein VFA70_12485 [Dehalococcoidia bacterium]|jgi:hypothetical protein|nr:hypothetical protein [Dehalococcoidia bacterium]
MLRLGTAAAAAWLLLFAGCSSSSRSNSATAPTARTAPPAQTALIRAATPPAAVTVAVQPSDVVRITNDLRLTAADLPPGAQPGPLEGTLSNEAAAVGFASPTAVVTLMQQTGRLGGIAQALTTGDGATGAGVSIEVWRDAQGAQRYFAQYPRPEGPGQITKITLPQPLGDESFAYQIEQNGQITYAVNWRRGRLILGVGERFPASQASLDKTLAIAQALDKKAAAEPQ